MANRALKIIIPIAIVVILILIIYGSFTGTYNKMVTMEEGVKASWSQVENQYQRRLDLIPNLVETVKGYASHESDTLTAVAEARASAGGVMNMSDDLLDDPAAFERFQEAQSSLGGALQRLLVVTENYPELKANQNFLALQDQLEGTENRISVERKRFNDSVQSYNTYIKQFPRMIIANMAGFDEKPYFEASSGAENAPKVEF
ncbi:MAG: LemA family protein [Spirochaetales bacterium]|uniref:LemA family protein n=1 Tax=Candidatus Thalassospirochaeta sargassi TaxID=3119039 RepID=A0AAJ1MN61_9SPIO|nr:LemA family protein [Spirochaetales bacterium]